MNTITKKNSNIYYQQHANKGARHYNRTQPKAPSALPWWKNSNYRICAATLAALGTLIVLSIYQRSGLVHLVNHLVEKNNKIGKIANGMIGKARNKIERELKNTLYIANLRPNGILQCPLDPIHHTAYYPAILFLTKNFHSLSDQHLKMENLFRTATAIRWAPLNFVNSDSIEKNPAETSPNAHNLKKRRISSLQPYCPKSTKSEGPAPYTLLPFERPLFRLRQSPGTNRSQKGVVLETNTPSSASDDPQKLSHDPQFTELKQPCYNSTVDTPNQTSLDEITSQENAMSTYHPGFEDKIISSYHTVRNFISNYWPNIIITAGIIFFFMARNRANRLHGAPGALGVFGGGINLANHGPENGQGGGINLANPDFDSL